VSLVTRGGRKMAVESKSSSVEKKVKKKWKYVTLRIPEKLYLECKEISDYRGDTVPVVIKSLIGDALERRERKRKKT